MRTVFFLALAIAAVFSGAQPQETTSEPCAHGLDPNDFVIPPPPGSIVAGLGRNHELFGPHSEPSVCLRNIATPLYQPPPGTDVGELTMHDILNFDCWNKQKCQSYGSETDAGTIDFSRAYAALRGIMQCEKRIANMMVRTCFHESGNYANNFSGFCSTREKRNDGDQSPEHRRCENTAHSFFDQGTVVVNAVARATGVSLPDTMAIGCYVAYEVTGGEGFLKTFPCNMQMGRCVKGNDESDEYDGDASAGGDPVEADPAATLPPEAADEDTFFRFWSSQGFTPEWAAALMTTHTLVDGKLFNMHHFDFEYIYTLALDFDKLGYRCDLRRGNIPNAGEIFGNEDRWGFTTMEGANFNEVTRYLLRVPIEGGPSKSCTCYDPQIQGVDGVRGKWTFTVNDCNMFRRCWDYTYFGADAVSPLEAQYCQAFKDFANNPDYFYRELGEATEFLTSKNTVSFSSQVSIVNLLAIRDQALRRDDLRIDLCEHKTPCIAEVMGDCLNNQFHDDVKAECGIPRKPDGRPDLNSDSSSRSFFRDHYECLANKVLASSLPVNVDQRAHVSVKRAPYQDYRTSAEDECISFEVQFSIPVDGLTFSDINVHAPGATVGDILVERIGSDGDAYRVQLCDVRCQHADQIWISIPENAVQTCNGYTNYPSEKASDKSDEVYCALCGVIAFEHVSFVDPNEVIEDLVTGEYVVKSLPTAMRVKAIPFPPHSSPHVEFFRPADFPVSETEKTPPFETTVVLRNEGEYYLKATSRCNFTGFVADGVYEIGLNVVEDPNRPIDCVGEWSEGKCLWGKRIDFFYITRHAENGGAECDPPTSTFRYADCGGDGGDGNGGGDDNTPDLENVIHNVRYANCETNEIGDIAEGITVQTGTNVNFAAEVGSSVKEIRWYFAETEYIGSDLTAPFSVFGDWSGNFQCYPLPTPGTFDFSGIPYNAKGEAGQRFRFNVHAEGPHIEVPVVTVPP